MEYVIRIPARARDKVTLAHVADCIARDVASTTPTFYKQVYEFEYAQAASALLDHVRSGRLQICDEFGNSYDIDPSADYSVPNMLSLYVKIDNLNLWAKPNGNSFSISNEGVEWIEGWHDEQSRMAVTVQGAGADTDRTPDSHDDVDGLKKREKQIRAIEAEANKAGYDKLNINTGCKAKLRIACKASRPDLFGAGDDPFNDAWNDAISCAPPRLRMADHNKFAGK